MGDISNFKDNNPSLSNASDSQKSSAITLAVKVESCEDNKYIIGTRVDNDQPVKVFLRPWEKTGNFDRPEIPSLYKNCGKNGILKFDSCYIDETGNYSSRWGKVLVDDPTKTNVLVALAYVNYAKKPSSNEEYIQIVTVHPKSSKNAGSLEDLTTILSNFLEAKTKGSNPFVFLKISDGEDVEVQKVYPKTVPDGDYKKKASGIESAKEFLDGKYSELVKSLIDKDNITVQVIPARVVYPGNKYKDSLLRHDYNRTVLSEVYNINKDDTNKPRALGFVNTILALRKHEDGTPYVIDVSVISQQDDPVLIKDL
jgi:hypothetical protein